MWGLALSLAFLPWRVAWAQAYLRTTSDQDPNVCLSWTGRAYTYNVHSAGSARTPGNSEFAAIEASVQTWRNVASGCSDFTFNQGPTTNDGTVGYNPTGANQNVITFREKSCLDAVPSGDGCQINGSCSNKYACWDHGTDVLALTTLSFNPRTGAVFDADVEFNAASVGVTQGFLFTTVDSPPCPPEDPRTDCVVIDIQNTLTHELGHVAGFAHVADGDSVMLPSAPPGEISKRAVDPGTAGGFCSVYPRGAPTPPCGEGITTATYDVIAVNRGTAGVGSWGCALGDGAGSGPGGSAAAILLSLLARLARHKRLQLLRGRD